VSRDRWEALGAGESPSWYLDPLAALQKREAHLDLVRRWTGGIRAVRMLKTDLFEDAFGEDRLVDALVQHTAGLCGMDYALSTARAAAERWRCHDFPATVMDVRALAWTTGAFDVVVSASTLDHFDERGEFVTALRELARVLSPGGLLILTLDNARNPLYHPLRWASQLGLAPFRLGYTPEARQLDRDLREAGLMVERREWLLHNPRVISTLLFLGARRILGRRAGGAVGGLMRAFDLLGRLPTRSLTACFVAVAARKPSTPDGGPR
jgi:SAM-dependent methyltransferase